MGFVLLTACSNDSDENSNDERVPLRIAACIDTQVQGTTRAIETRWEDDDQIGIYMTTYRTTNIFTDGDGTRGENLEYTFGDSDYETWESNTHTYRLFTSSSKKIYLSSTSVDVYGYYPYSATMHDGRSAVDPKAIEIDVSNQTSQKAIDFMRAKTENVNNNVTAIQLLFEHKLVKLVFNLKQGEGLQPNELKNATIEAFTVGGQPTNASYNIFSDAILITPGDNAITPHEMAMSSVPDGYVRSFEAIVLPNAEGTNPAADRTVTITFYTHADDPITNTFTIDSATPFEPGCKYVYNVTVNATSILVNPEKYAEQW